MGGDAGDFEQERQMVLVVANIDQEIFSLYRNNGDGTFDDLAMPLGIGMSTRWMSGWGLKFFDYDNDGNLDLILANGFPDDLIDQTSSLVTWKEPLLLFHNERKTFRNARPYTEPASPPPFPAP